MHHHEHHVLLLTCSVSTQERIEYYKVRYEPLSTEVDGDLSFIKLVDVGRYFIIHRIEGYLQMRISRFVVLRYVCL